MCVALSNYTLLVSTVLVFIFYFHSAYPCDDALYRNVLSGIPEECCTIPLIMDAMLEQVHILIRIVSSTSIINLHFCF